MKQKRGNPSGIPSKPAFGPAVLPALILTAALIFRFVGLTTFPVQFDEAITGDVVSGLWHGQWSNNWKDTVSAEDYRVDLYNFSSYMYADGLLAGSAAHFTNPLVDGNPDFVTSSRVLSALLGTLAVYLFYLVTRRLFGWVTAILGMALMALMPLLVQDAHYARPEAFTVLLTGAAYFFLLRFDSHRDRPRYLGYASFLFGLLIACKVSLAPMASLPVLFLVQAQHRQFWIRAAAICAGGTLLGMFVGMPDAFFHPAAYWHGVEFLRKQYAQGSLPHFEIDSNNSVRLTADYFWHTTGMLTLLALAGAFVLARRKRFVVLTAIAGPVAFYLVFFCAQRTFFERNLSHAAPFIAMLAAVAITAIGDMVPLKSRTAVLMGLLALAAVPEVWVSSKLVFVAMSTNTEMRCQQYQSALLRRVQRAQIDLALGLVYEAQLNEMVTLAQNPQHDYLFRVIDTHDDFTKAHLEELRRRTTWREVGYFPSLFEGMEINTLIAYHSYSYRYLLLPGPDHAP